MTFEISNDDEEDIENEKYKECLKLFKDVKEENVRKYQNHYYCDKLINNEKLEGEYAFIYWLIENQNSKKDFIQILNDFFIKKPIQEAYCRRKNKISIWKNKTSIKVEILFFYKP